MRAKVGDRTIWVPPARRWPTWAVEWRGKITRDVGVEYEQQPSAKIAREIFQSRYPMREIMAISRATENES